MKVEYPTDGLIVSPPWMAEGVLDGSKTLLVKPRELDMGERQYLLISERKALGVVELGEVEEIDRKELLKREDEHLITEKLLGEWARLQPTWGGEKFWVWPIEVVEAFEEPKDTNVKVGPQTVARDVEVEKAGPFQRWGGSSKYAKRLAKMFPPHEKYVEPFAGAASVFFAKQDAAKESVLADKDPEVVHALRMIRDLNDDTLTKLGAHSRSFSWGTYKQYIKKIPKDAVERLHRFLYVQGFSWAGRRSGHCTGKKQAYDLSKLKRWAERLAGTKIECADYVKTLRKHAGKGVLVFLDPPYPGEWSELTDDLPKGEGNSFDLDLFVKQVKALKCNWFVALGDQKEHRDALRKLGGRQFSISTHEVGREKTGNAKRARYFATNVKQTTKRDAPVERQEPRAAPAKFLRQARRAAKDDKLTLGEFFFQPKPTRPAFPEQPQSVENLIKLFRDHPEDYPFPWFVQKKYDGVRVQASRDGDKVLIISEDGSDNTARLPGLVKEVLELKDKKLVLDVELERWDGRQHLPRETMSGYLASKDEPDDSDVIANVFDVLYTEKDGDIHTWPAHQRLKKLAGLGVKQSTMEIPDLRGRLNAAPGIKVHDLEEMEKVTRMVRDLPGSEGIVAKQADASYPLELVTPDSWVKYHSASPIRGLVLGRTRTKGGAWVYRWGVLPGKAEAKETVELKGREVVPVGDSFATSLDFKEGDHILIEAETVNLIKSLDGVEMTAWVPRVLGDYQGKPDTVDSAAARAKRNLVLQVKEVDEEGEVSYVPTRKALKQVDPYMEIPDEDGRYRYTVQHHFRGRSLHSDLRLEFRPNDLLVGWTMNTQIADVVKVPVVTLAQARAWMARIDDLSKINWRTGEWAERRKRGAKKPVRVSIVSERKAPEPYPWIDVEGKTKDPVPGKPPPVGGTREFPGVFHIVDQGEVQFLSQKPWFHEYAVHGRGMNYRLFFRQLKLGALHKIVHDHSLCMRCEKKAPKVDVLWADGRGRAWFCKKCYPAWLKSVGGKKEAEIVKVKAIIGPKALANFDDVHKRVEIAKSADLHPLLVDLEKRRILPPSEAPEEKPLGKAQWLAIQPDDLTPYVLDKDAVDKAWMPPVGISALPREVRKQIPKEFQFWKRRTKPDARKVRDELYAALKEKTVELDYTAPYKTVRKASLLDADFVLQEQTWRGPIQIRVGPSKTLWWVRLDIGRPSLLVLQLFLNPLDNEELAALVDKDPHKESMKIEGPVKPSHYLNPTKDTPSNISILDKGKAEVLSLSDDFVKVNFKGKKLKGLYAVKRSDGDWLWSPSEEGPDVEKRAEALASLSYTVPILKVDKEKRLVTGIVLEPGTVDAHEDTVSAEVIERAAHKFLARYNHQTRLGLMHKTFGDNGLELAESFVAPVDLSLNGEKIKQGSWLMTVKVINDALWAAAKKGAYTGFSIGGTATV